MEKDLTVDKHNFSADSLPKKYENSRDGVSEPLTNEVIVLGEDVYSSNSESLLPEQSDDFTVSITTLPELADIFAKPIFEQITPVHVEEGQGLLECRAHDVATIAVANAIRFPEFYEGLRNDIQKAVNEHALDLATKFPNEEPATRVGLYAKEIVTKHLQTPADVLLADVNPGLISNEIIASPARMRELELDNNKLRKVLAEKQSTLYALRALRVSEGASVQELREFDQVAKLLTAPEREAYEHGSVQNPRKLTELFKSIVQPLMSRTAFDAIGRDSPRSAATSIVTQQEKTSA